MKRFVFRLQVVLDRALEEEQELLKELAHEQYALTRQEQAIAEFITRRHGAREEMAEKQRTGCDVWELGQYRLHLDELANRLALLEDERKQQEARVEQARARVVEAMRKRQVLEKLREKQLNDYQETCAKEELRAMEETMLPRLERERKLELHRRRQAGAEG